MRTHYGKLIDPTNTLLTKTLPLKGENCQVTNMTPGTYLFFIISKGLLDSIHFRGKSQESASTTNNNTFLNSSLQTITLSSCHILGYMGFQKNQYTSEKQIFTFVALRASSTLSFFSFSSVSVCAPT